MSPHLLDQDGQPRATEGDAWHALRERHAAWLLRPTVIVKSNQCIHAEHHRCRGYLITGGDCGCYCHGRAA